MFAENSHLQKKDQYKRNKCKSISKTNIDAQRSEQQWHAAGPLRYSAGAFHGFLISVLSGVCGPLMLLWKSWGKMPLGASWWNTQRRNCLATPATFPGINVLQDIIVERLSDRWPHFTSLIKVIYKHSEYLSAAVTALMSLTSRLVQKNWH